MEESDLDVSNYEDLMPETEAYPAFVVRIIAIYDARGMLGYRVALDNTQTVPVTSVIGVMSMCSTDISMTAIKASRMMLGEQAQHFEVDMEPDDEDGMDL